MFTSSCQLVIVDIMLGHYTRVERPMEKGDDIIDITMTDKHVILYNNKYFRYSPDFISFIVISFVIFKKDKNMFKLNG